MRRLALLFALVFFAGPAIHLECFVACWAAAAAEISSDACHVATTDDPASRIAGADDCGDTGAYVSPFVKTTTSASVPAAVRVEVSADQRLPTLVPTHLTPPRIRPPDPRALVSLRI